MITQRMCTTVCTCELNVSEQHSMTKRSFNEWEMTSDTVHMLTASLRCLGQFSCDFCRKDSPHCVLSPPFSPISSSRSLFSPCLPPLPSYLPFLHYVLSLAAPHHSFSFSVILGFTWANNSTFLLSLPLSPLSHSPHCR